MKEGTAIGLLVGGAVLILAAHSHQSAVAAAAGQPAPPVSQALNPFSWFTGATAGGGALPALPSPANAGGGVQPTAYNGTPAAVSPNYYGAYNQVYTPGGSPATPNYYGGGSAVYTPGGSPATPNYYAGGSGGYQNAAFSPNYTPGGSPATANYYSGASTYAA